LAFLNVPRPREIDESGSRVYRDIGLVQTNIGKLLECDEADEFLLFFRGPVEFVNGSFRICLVQGDVNAEFLRSESASDARVLSVDGLVRWHLVLE
jgi:hypothetical protein